MSAVTWLPLKVRGVEFGYKENPLFKDFQLSLTQPGYYRITSSGHINASLYLLRFLAGLSQPRRGELFCGERCLTEMSFEEFLPWTQAMGYAFESGGLLSNKTVHENLMLPLQYHQRFPWEECLERVQKALKDYDLMASKDKRPADIPPSDYKMTVLVRSLIHQPKILLLAAPEEGIENDRFLKFADQVRGLRNQGTLEAVLYTSQTQFSFSDSQQYEIQLSREAAHVGAVA